MPSDPVIAAQEKILANQGRIEGNRSKLDMILANQQEILTNQKKIRASQKKIRAKKLTCRAGQGRADRVSSSPRRRSNPKTTNVVGSVQSRVCQRTDKADCCKQLHRWFDPALIDVEPRLRKVCGHRHLSKLRRALQALDQVKAA